MDGHLDSDSILGNPSLSPCVVFSQTFALAPGFPAPCLPPLLPQVAELQERATAQSQEQAILQRSLEDRAAQVEVARMGAKVSVCGRQGLREAWQALGAWARAPEKGACLYRLLHSPCRWS